MTDTPQPLPVVLIYRDPAKGTLAYKLPVPRARWKGGFQDMTALSAAVTKEPFEPPYVNRFVKTIDG